MSLQAHGPQFTFAHRMYRLWCVWNSIVAYHNAIGPQNATAGYAGPAQNAPQQQQGAAPLGLPPGLNHAPQLRQTFLRDAVQASTLFMPTPAIVFQPQHISSFGFFNHTQWTCYVNSFHFNANAITYGQFLKLCGTIYHEVRHAEQFYRIAQGLSGGLLTFPDLSADRFLRAMGQANTVQNTVNRFQAAVGGGQGAMTAGMVANLMAIPNNVAQSASNNARASFTAYVRLGVPRWFKRRTAQEEVEDWLQAQYSTAGQAAQPNNAMLHANARYHNNNVRPNNVFAMYESHPMERDSFAIEASVTAMIAGQINVPAQQGGIQQRNGNLFNHLPNR